MEQRYLLRSGLRLVLQLIVAGCCSSVDGDDELIELISSNAQRVVGR